MNLTTEALSAALVYSLILIGLVNNVVVLVFYAYCVILLIRKLRKKK